MPNLDFYAAHNDHESVLSWVFAHGGFRVFELSSKPDSEVVEFSNLEHLKTHFEFSNWQEAPVLLLQLLAVKSGGTPSFRRVNYNTGAVESAKFCYKCEGWGLIQLYLQKAFSDLLRASHTNHNSEKRAITWSQTIQMESSPNDWDWTEIASASRRLNSFIKKQGKEKLGARPVLPVASQLRASGTKLN